MVATKWLGVVVLAALPLSASFAGAQDDPFADEDIAGDAPAEEAPAPESETPAEPEAQPEPEPEAPAEPAPEAPLDAEASASAEVSLDAIAADADVDTESTPAKPSAEPAKPRLTAASHIRRPVHAVDGAQIIDSPLRTDVQGGEYLRSRRQHDGIAVPDTTAALGHGAPGTSRFNLRLQPTLVLLNGRRLVAAPVIGTGGADFVDINQLPIQLIGRVEQTSGLAAGLWGADAMGGVANFTTRRDIEGIDVELGGQSTDKFDQGDFDIAVTLGTGETKTGGNLMLSYFNRLPLAATDRDWIGERDDRVESLVGAPANYQKIINGDYPISDPYCNLAQRAGYSNGYEVRLKGYGSTDNVFQLRPDLQAKLFMNHDATRGDPATRNNMIIEQLETSTYCAVDFTPHNDLILKDERLQAYTTFWHALSDHTEAFGEAGVYRSENENRTAPSFPTSRLTPSAYDLRPATVPAEHADQPEEAYGFAGSEVPTNRVATPLFFFGRTQGLWNGASKNERRVDVLRGVLGLKGDFAGIAPTGPLSTWDWDLAGTFSRSDQVSRVNDTLMDALIDAFEACNATRIDPTNNMTVNTTIKQRQEAGCFSPFFSSVINNAAIDPLNVSSASADNARGFITTDSDPYDGFGYGVQDGGYICDPNDPNSPPCPAEFDQDGDGIYELAGTPNTKQVIDRITGEHYEVQQRTLITLGANLRGDIATFGSSSLAFGLGAELRRESLYIAYDQAYNERQYGFLVGGDDIDPVGRNIVGGNAELRLRLADGLFELQPAAKVELYEETGAGLNALLGFMLRPLAGSGTEALEWLGLRGHVGLGAQPPSLIQLYGAQNEFVQVDYRDSTHFVAHQVSGNPDLDFERYMTISAGPAWDYAGIHVGAEFWMTFITDVIGFDNARALVNDCEAQLAYGNPECREMVLLEGFPLLDHLESGFDNLAEVDTNGVDGILSYTLDTKRRGLGDIGTFVLAVQGTYINSYLIRGPRVLPVYYRDNAPEYAASPIPPGGVSPADHDYPAPTFNADGTRSYDNLNAEYEAAGFRNYENFAPPIPKLRFSVPVRWLYEGHTLGATVRFIDGYYDDSEYTIEKQNLPGVDRIQLADGEKIDPWMVFDAMYGFAFDAEGWKGGIQVGVLNIADTPPPPVESPLGYEVGLHDPRGRTLYARVSGDF